ncbi:hypothetical protein [Asticcacaulis sp.]|uniref:hypothetical protein n=1 Tax=Asticcacaulis sp. TaxID=1872648 RepID=UPI00262D950C|nr:hypothetical protein [Asticcacaulis sp.]
MNSKASKGKFMSLFRSVIVAWVCLSSGTTVFAEVRGLPISLTSATATPVQVKSPQPAEHLTWAKVPTARDFLSQYPAKARKEKVDGNVIVECVIRDMAGHVQCQVASEAPEGYDFGKATVWVMEKKALAAVKSPADIGRVIKLRQVWVS